MNYPDIQSFFLETPLYNKFTIKSSHDVVEYINKLVNYDKVLDCYCIHCNKQSTFSRVPASYSLVRDMYAEHGKRSSSDSSADEWFIEAITPRLYQVDFKCARDQEHKIYFSFYITRDFITKTGQFPSFADLSQPGLKKYRQVLSSEKYKELAKGIGLTSHGIGIGAFVYLRRIFENLIEEARIEAAKQFGWDEDKFQRARMDEKIQILNHDLPEFLVSNKILYNILSKGIHELSEQECLDYFDTVKLGIELILDEKLESKKRQLKIASAEKSINQIHQSIKSNSLQ